MNLINRIKCFFNGHYYPGSPKDMGWYYEIICERCGKKEIQPYRPISLEDSIERGLGTTFKMKEFGMNQQEWMKYKGF